MMQEKKGQVLCVDDEPALLRSLQWLLETDFDVKTATGGEAGLQALEENDFDVIISDQRMPGMTGAEFLCQAKAVSPRATRILLTGYSDMEALLSSVNEGEIWRFIKKPWNREELSGTVETAAAIAKQSAQEGENFGFDMPFESTRESKVLVISDDQEIHRIFRENPVDNVQVVHTDNLSQAVQVVSKEQIGTIVSEVKIGSTDVTHFISLLKQKQPEIVSVVMADKTDLKQLIKLINDGQVYRYSKKPIEQSYLKHLVSSAMAKHMQLVSDPGLRARHAAAECSENLEQTLIQELGLLPSEDAEHQDQDSYSSQHATDNDADTASPLRKVFKKLFSRS